VKLPGIILTIALTAGATLPAQVPPDIAAQLRRLGPVVDPASTAAIYRPLQTNPPYRDVTVTRDVSYGPDPRQIMDIFMPAMPVALPLPVAPAVSAAPTVPAALAPTPPIAASRPVLIFVSGGAGNKIEPVPDGDAFYDNIMLWAVGSGMTAVNMQRLAGPGRASDDAANDVGQVVDWVQRNIARYGGDPNRVFIWAHSAGNGPVGAYIGSPLTESRKAHGLKGAVLMGATSGTLPAAITAALAKTDVSLFVAAGQIDLPAAVTFVDALKDELCNTGTCPATTIFEDHSHMSTVFSPNTADVSVTGAILKWMQTVK
jgi:acetyl esterase/lipase